MANQIDRDAFVKRDVLKNPIPYTRGTDLLPIVIHFRDFQIPSGATARVFVAKADGNAVYTTATIDGNDVTVDVTDQMFIELGTALMQISIMDGEEELVSFVQPVDVQQNLKAGDLPASTTDVKFLDEAIEQANEAVNTATTAAQQAATAVQSANQAIEDANEAISDLNTQIASLNTNFASLANNVSISQLDTTAKTLVEAIDELNSKTFGNIIYYNADTDMTVVSNRANAIKYIYTTYANTVETYTTAVIRYAGGYYYNYIITRIAASGGVQALEYSIHNNEINIWNINRTSGESTISRTFSDDATVILAAQNTTPPYKIFSSSSNDQEVDEYLGDYSQPYAPHTHYYIALNLAFVHSTLGGGDMLIEGYKSNENYEWQKATKYDSSGIVSFARSKMNQIWTDWNSKNIS